MLSIGQARILTLIKVGSSVYGIYGFAILIKSMIDRVSKLLLALVKLLVLPNTSLFIVHGNSIQVAYSFTHLPYHLLLGPYNALFFVHCVLLQLKEVSLSLLVDSMSPNLSLLSYIISIFFGVEE